MSDKIETSPVDNGFEKVDAMLAESQEQPSSTTGEPTAPEADLYSKLSSEAEAAQGNLLDLDVPPPPAPVKVPEPSAPVMPDSPSQPQETEPAPAEEKKTSPGAWLKNVDPREHVSSATSTTPSTGSESFVIELIYWRDIKKSAVVFASMFILLLSLALFSVLSVAAYLSLAALTVTVSFVVYKKVLQAVQKMGDGHPFKHYLDVDIDIPEDKIHEMSDMVAKHVLYTAKQLRRLFLVEDMVDSLKFGLLLWVLTYIGSWFNGMTLLILGLIGIFTLPKVYETYQVQIDHYIGTAKTKVEEVMKQVQEKIPLPGKKKQS